MRIYDDGETEHRWYYVFNYPPDPGAIVGTEDAIEIWR
jgi:hypothetical protein